MKSFMGKSDNHWPRQISRNVLGNGKSTTAISMTRSVIRSGTPLKLISFQKSARGENLASSRLIQQNTELKKKNNDLLHLLKKSKDIIKNEMGKYKEENLIMRKFAEASWIWVESKIEGQLKDELKPFLSKLNIKTNTTENDYTNHCSAEDNVKFINKKNNENKYLTMKLNEVRAENERINEYLRFLERNSSTRKTKPLIVSSENVESDTEEEIICPWSNEVKDSDNSNSVAMPTFIKSLRLGFQ